MSSAYQPELEPLRASVQAVQSTTATGGSGGATGVDNQYKYEGKDDDRPLIWRDPLNELQGAINELLVKRKKKLGASLSRAENVTPIDDDDEPNLNRPRSARLSARGPRRQSQQVSRIARPDSSRRNSARDSGSRERPGSARRDSQGRASSSRGLPGATSARAYSTQADKLGGGRPEEDDDWDDMDDEELLRDDDDDDYEKPEVYLGPAEDDAPRQPGGGEDTRLRDARREQLQKAKDEYRAKTRELEQVRAVLHSEDVLLKIRRSHSAELQASIVECEEGAEQAHTWIKALEDVHVKRKTKLQEHDEKLAKAKKAIEDSERSAR